MSLELLKEWPKNLGITTKEIAENRGNNGLEKGTDEESGEDWDVINLRVLRELA